MTLTQSKNIKREAVSYFESFLQTHPVDFEVMPAHDLSNLLNYIFSFSTAAKLVFHVSENEI